MSPLSASPPEIFVLFLSLVPCPSLSLMLRISSRSVRLLCFRTILRSPPGLPASCSYRTSAHSRLTTRQQSNPYFFFLRKEVIQPHLPIRLPCYDFTPVTGSTFDSSLPKVGSLASGISDSHGVTGGVYKTRERIHRDILIRDY